MKSYLLISLLLIELIGCKGKDMTLEELKKASWSKLDKGVEYISLKNGKPKFTDSIHFSVKGFWGSNITIPGDVYNEFRPTLDTTLGRILTIDLPNSKHGYLKINLYQMTSPDYLNAAVFLRDDIDSIELNNGINKIRAIKGITDVSYISKDMAKKKYLDDGNSNWEEVLDSNPLPASIEIKLDKKIITPEDYESFKNKITSHMLLYVSDITITSDLLKKFENNYYILEYNRY